jgi:hypothetical protein
LEKINNEIIVYWSPWFLDSENSDWNMLYYPPENILNRLAKNKNNKNNSDNFFQCPSVTSLFKNTFALKNSIDSKFSIIDNKVITLGNSGIEAQILRPESINNQTSLQYNLRWIFFSECDDLNMRLTSPFFSKCQHLKYGNIVPGEFNIGMWFRNINLEYNLWENVKSFHVEENEDLAYISFDSKNKIKLVRFEMNDKLHSYSNSTATSSTWEPKVSLLKRYNRFKETKMKELVLKEIKNNIVF